MKHSKMQFYFTVGGRRDCVSVGIELSSEENLSEFGSKQFKLTIEHVYGKQALCVSNQNASLLSQDSGTVAIWLYLLKDYVTGQKFSNNEEHLQFWLSLQSKESLCQNLN